MSSNNRAVLWDLDGTLVDSYRAHFHAWTHITSEYDIPFDDVIFADSFGRTNDMVLKEWLGERWTPELAQEISERKEAYYREVTFGEVVILPGAVAWLDRMQAAGWKQGIASSAPWPNIQVILDAFDWRGYFDAVCSGEALPSKPDPAVFLATARELNMAAARCVVAEDAPAGITGARRAGMRCIALTTTYPAEAFGAMPDIIVPNLAALPFDAFDRLIPQDG
ncbi:MAG: HAD family phosphatase [Anaerolineae bacterium]|nr:HAD family phosphatase [Anaerolineae bacterium]